MLQGREKSTSSESEATGPKKKVYFPKNPELGPTNGTTKNAPKMPSVPRHVNDKGPHVLELVYQVGRKSFRGLVDTGADQSVVDVQFARMLETESNGEIEKYALYPPIELVVGDGGKVVVDAALKVKLFIKPTFHFDVVFVKLLLTNFSKYLVFQKFC